MATLKLFPNTHVKAESAYLNQFESNITSQAGEDGIVEKIFEIFPLGTGSHLSNEVSAFVAGHRAVANRSYQSRQFYLFHPFNRQAVVTALRLLHPVPRMIDPVSLP
jgi:hypothetical protein